MRRSERAAADNQDARRLQAALPFLANSVEKNLSTIAVRSLRFSIAVNDRYPD